MKVRFGPEVLRFHPGGAGLFELGPLVPIYAARPHRGCSRPSKENAMPAYKAPVEDALFLLNDVFQIERFANLPGLPRRRRMSSKPCSARRRDSAKRC